MLQGSSNTPPFLEIFLMAEENGVEIKGDDKMGVSAYLKTIIH
jgi:hypothetical protein